MSLNLAFLKTSQFINLPKLHLLKKIFLAEISHDEEILKKLNDEVRINETESLNEFPEIYIDQVKDLPEFLL